MTVETTAVSACHDYAQRLGAVLAAADWTALGKLSEDLLDCAKSGRQVFICGNGGSAANAMHIANDLVYGITKTLGRGVRITALPANGSVLTCLANDEGYDKIFSHQLGVYANRGDILIVLSGSGNSPNILAALEAARELGVRSYAILGYSGGKAKAMADVAIHFDVNDMQISEDMQLISAHMIMQWLFAKLNGGAC